MRLLFGSGAGGGDRQAGAPAFVQRLRVAGGGGGGLAPGARPPPEIFGSALPVAVVEEPVGAAAELDVATSRKWKVPSGLFSVHLFPETFSKWPSLCRHTSRSTEGK